MRQSRLKSAFFSVLDIILPQRCVVCAGECQSPVFPGMPLCRSCAGRLPFLSGRKCPSCGKPLISEDVICTDCRDISWNFNSNSFLFYFQGEARELIHAYKFGGRRNLAGVFAAWLSDLESPGGRPCTGGYDAIVPVPAHPRNLLSRGYDQVMVLAAGLSRLCAIPVVRSLGRRTGGMQKNLSREERKQNLRKQLFCNARPKAAGKVLLLDDIFTTGTTVNECAGLLKAAGAGEVHVFTLAMEE